MRYVSTYLSFSNLHYFFYISPKKKRKPDLNFDNQRKYLQFRQLNFIFHFFSKVNILSATAKRSKTLLQKPKKFHNPHEIMK